MSGSATFTMVTSTSSMNVPRQTATRGAHLRISGSFRPRVFRPWGQVRPGALTAPGLRPTIAIRAGHHDLEAYML